MKSSLRTLGITIPILISALASTTLRCVACLTELNYSTGYYDNSTLATVSGWIAALTVALLLGCLLIRRENTERHASFRGPLTYIPAGALAIALLFSAADLLGYAAESSDRIGDLIKNSGAVTALIATLLSLGAIGYLAAMALIPTVRSSLRANLGMLAALFFACYTAHLFFRIGTPINHPAKIADEMAMLAAALFLLFETRISLGRAKWGAYFIFGTISSILTAYSSIPALAVYIFKGEVISETLTQSLLIFATLIFSVCRLIHAARLAPDIPSGYAVAIDAMAEKDESDSAETEPAEELPQISIEDIADEPERQSEE